MDKKLEAKLRSKVRKLVESVLNEEPPVSSPKDDPKQSPVKARRAIMIGDIKVDIGNLVGLKDMTTQKQIIFKREDAVRLAKYLYRVLGKV